MSSVDIVLIILSDNGKVDDNFAYLVNNRPVRHEQQRVITVTNADSVRAIAPDKVLNNNQNQVIVNSNGEIEAGTQRFTITPYKAAFNLVHAGRAIIAGAPVLFSTPRSNVRVRLITGPGEQVLLGGSIIKNMRNATADIPQTVRGMWEKIPKRTTDNADLFEVIGTCVLSCSEQNMHKVVCATNQGKVLPAQNLRPIPFNCALFGLVAPAPAPAPAPVAVVDPHLDDIDLPPRDGHGAGVANEEEEEEEEEDNGEEDEEAHDDEEEDDPVPTTPYRAPRAGPLKAARLAEVTAEIAFLQAKLARLQLERNALM